MSVVIRQNNLFVLLKCIMKMVKLKKIYVVIFFGVNKHPNELTNGKLVSEKNY